MPLCWLLHIDRRGYSMIFNEWTFSLKFVALSLLSVSLLFHFGDFSFFFFSTSFGFCSLLTVWASWCLVWQLRIRILKESTLPQVNWPKMNKGLDLYGFYLLVRRRPISFEWLMNKYIIYRLGITSMLLDVIETCKRDATLFSSFDASIIVIQQW